MLLDRLDDSIFAALEDAYGPAVDVPAQLRALASPDLERAREALEDLDAGIFHQGSYFSATAPSVPSLIELAGAEIPARAHVLLFLADMHGGADDPELAFQPYLFRSTPGLPDYPEAVATIEAIHAGRETYLAALGSGDPSVRACAALLLARLGDPSFADPLARALTHETDPDAAISFAFALARLGRRPETELAGRVADVLAVLDPTVVIERRLDGIARLLVLDTRPTRERMPWFDGDLVRFAALALVEQGRADSRAFQLASRALSERLARGERIRALPRPPSTRVCDEPGSEPASSFADYFSDLPLRSIAGAMAALAFGDRAEAPRLLRREELDEPMRQVLALTRDHAIPVPIAGAPWIEPAAMARFLAGGGPLDEEIAWAGERQPLFVVLRSLTGSERGPEPADAAADVDRVFTELARTWTPARLVALAIDILDDGYGLARYQQPLPAIASALARHVVPLAPTCAAQLDAYAERLLEREHPTGAQARFALANSIAAGQPVAARFDRLARAAIASDREAGREWLASFPEPRRSRIVAAYGNAFLFGQLGSVCDPETLEPALLDAFLDPECSWFAHEAEALLSRIADTERLVALRATCAGRRATILDRVIQARTRAGVFELELRVAGEGIHATVRDGGGAFVVEHPLSASPKIEELAVLVERCEADGEALIELVGDVDSTTRYRVMRLLGDAGYRGTVRAGGSTFTHGREGRGS